MCCFLSINVDAQKSDTTMDKTVDTTLSNKKAVVKKHSHKLATRRSAMVPGWGQAYNREYWKIPLVYGALGTAAGIYFYNDKWYKKSRIAYIIRTNKDTLRFPEIDSKLEPLDTESLRFYRNEFRKNKDYSLLWFLIAWGVNVVDATVFGHLKDFDVSDDLSLQIKPVFQANGNAANMGFAFTIKSPSHKAVRLK
jgi:hypothetical protein